MSKFAAYKAFHLTENLKSIESKDKAEFKQIASRVIKKFNQWAATENNTITSRSRTAKQFKQFEEDKDVMPNLKWIRSRSSDPREQHLAIAGTILPINDPFWNTHQPGNLWNCKCDWVQTDEPVNKPTNVNVKAAKGLEGNPAETREIFSNEHPYFSKTKGNKDIDKFIHDNVDFSLIEKYDNGGIVYQHAFVDIKSSDYKEVSLVAKFFSKEGKSVEIMPEINKKNNLYKELFNGAYENKCPDLKINNVFYEVKSFQKPFGDNSLGNMITKGFRQSDRIVIDIRGTGLDIKDVRSIIFDRLKQKNKPNIKEVWVIKDNKIEKAY